MSLVQNFNVNPYYDDYDEDKKYLKLLFKPGYALQARELTQIQSILQKQVERFGTHIFRNGSVVTGGEVSYSTTVTYLKLETTDSNGNNIDVNNFLNKKIAKTSTSEGSIARVIAVIEATDTDPPTIIIQFAVATVFNVGDSFYTFDSDAFEGRVLNEANAIGASSVAFINEGVYYIDGYFIKVSAQTIPLEKYSINASYRIGLEFNDSVITELEDTSLLDPALNASNYQAPGAARYKITLTLAKRTLTSTDDTKFFEIIRLENSQIVYQRIYPIYSELEKTFARRTYDESGNYTVKPFLIEVKDNVPSLGNTANSELLTVSLSPGKAYIRGFEFETVSARNIDISRARTKANVINYDIESNYGNYLEVSNVKGLFDISTMSSIDLHCVDVGKINTANTNLLANTKIGTARIRQIEYVSAANTGNTQTYKYNFYIFDTNFVPITGNATGGNTTSIILGGLSSTSSNAYSGSIIRITTGLAGDNAKRTIINYDASTKTATVDPNLPFTTSPGANSVYNIDFNIKDIESFVVNSSATLIATANVSDTNKTGTIATGNTFLSDTDFNSLVFKIPENFISFGMSDQDYRGRKVFKNQTVTTGVLNLSTGDANQLFVGSGALSETQKLEHFLVYANNVSGAPEFTSNQAITFATSSGRSITVSGSAANLSFATGNTFTVDIIATVDFNSSVAKTKTYVEANTTNVAVTGGTTIGSTTIYPSFGQIAISSPNKRNGSSDNLYISDVHKLNGDFDKQYGRFNVQIGSSIRKGSFKVIDSGNPAVAVAVADLTNSSKDITDRYILNDGQKDNYYDHASITLKPYVNPPIGQILVLVNYFTHSGSGYLTVDSYNVASLSANTDSRYAQIPSFTSPTNGTILSLRDCVDFRPIRTNATTNFTLNGISITKAEEALESDYSYYLPRKDKITLTQDRTFKVLTGNPSLTPVAKPDDDLGMTLYELNISPYTFFPTDVKIRYFENKRYTMRDIGRLEKRIGNLEYYSLLNTLEKSAADLTVLDSDGLERFKNGILVDSFRGHQIGDVGNIDYNCSMDFEKGELRPFFTANALGFIVDTSTATANLYAGNTVVSLPFTSSNLIAQNVSSRSLAVNPFNLNFYSGAISLFPASDYWIDTENRPDVLVNLEGENDAWENIGKALEDLRAPGFGTQFGDYTIYNTGQSSQTQLITQQRQDGTYIYQDTISRTTVTTDQRKFRTGTNTTVVPDRIVENIGNRQVDLSVVPYIRSQPIKFVAKNLKPNKFAYLYFDDTYVNKFIEMPSCFELINVSSNFISGYGAYETITSSSGGTATAILQQGRSWAAPNSYLYVTNMRGTFAANDTITGSQSLCTAVINSLTWNASNVVTANATSITLGSGAPYTNWYTDIGNTFNSISHAQARDWYSHPNRSNTALNYSVDLGYNRVRIVSGKGAGQNRTITNYNGNTKVATVNTAWDVIPDQTSIWSVLFPSTDDFGYMSGTFHLPNLDATTYLSETRFTTGSKIFRIVDNKQNNPILTTMIAERSFEARGILNIIEDISVSIRVPVIKVSNIYEDVDAGPSYAVQDTTVKSTVIGYVYSGGGGSDGDGAGGTGTGTGCGTGGTGCDGSGTGDGSGDSGGTGDSGTGDC
jgi:hypothetical protein